MKVEVINYQDNWQAVKNAAMNTIGSEFGTYPSPAWKRKILLAEHSPIRLIELTIRMHEIPYWFQSIWLDTRSELSIGFRLSEQTEPE